MDGGGGFDGGDLGGESAGAGLAIEESKGIGGGGGRGGWTVEGNLCCISIFMLKRKKSLKDLSEASNVFLINKEPFFHGFF